MKRIENLIFTALKAVFVGIALFYAYSFVTYLWGLEDFLLQQRF